MKKAVVCLAAMAMCACCRETDNSHSRNSRIALKTNDKVNRLLKEHYPGPKRGQAPLSAGPFVRHSAVVVV